MARGDEFLGFVLLGELGLVLCRVFCGNEIYRGVFHIFTMEIVVLGWEEFLGVFFGGVGFFDLISLART